jgi:hypothetical protein
MPGPIPAVANRPPLLKCTRSRRLNSQSQVQVPLCLDNGPLKRLSDIGRFELGQEAATNHFRSESTIREMQPISPDSSMSRSI